MKNWSEDEIKQMVALFWEGLSSDDIAERMPWRTAKAIRGKWERLRLTHEQRLAVLGKDDGDDAPRAVADRAEMARLVRMTLTGDAAFVRAMLKARRSGAENITLGVVKTHGTDAISTKSFRAETYMATASCLESL